MGLLPIRDHRVEHRTSDSDEETREDVCLVFRIKYEEECS